MDSRRAQKEEDETGFSEDEFENSGENTDIEDWLIFILWVLYRTRFKGHYLASSRRSSLAHQKSVDCLIFIKICMNINSTLLFSLRLIAFSYDVSLNR